MPYKFKVSSELDQISFVYEPYKEGGQIWLFIAGCERQENLIPFKELFAANQIQYTARRFDPGKTPDGYLFAMGIEDCRKVVDCLYTNQKIAPADRADIEPELRKIDVHLKNLRQVTEETSTAQADIINDVFGMYFEEIFDIAGNLKTALIFLKTAISDYPSWPNYAQALNHLLRGILAKNKFDENTKTRLFGAMHALSNAFHGRANLESAFSQSGSGIPALELQKKILISYAKDYLIKKFSDLDNTVLFNTILELNMHILLGYVPGKLGESTNIVDNITIPSKTAFNLDVISVKPDILVKLIAMTLNETNLSINEIAAYEREKLLKMFKQSWELLQASGLTTTSLTNEEQQYCLNILKKMDNSSELHIDVASKDNMQKSAPALKVLRELLHYQKLIQNGKYFEKRQLMKNMAGAAEKRNNKKKPPVL